MRTAARIPKTAKVSSSSIRVRARRDASGGLCPSLPARAVGKAHHGLASVQALRFDGVTGIGCLVRAAAEQLILLLQQLFYFPQLANLIGPLVHGVGKRRLTSLRGR